MKIAINKRKLKRGVVCKINYNKKEIFSIKLLTGWEKKHNYFLNDEAPLNKFNLIFSCKNTFEYLVEKGRQNDFLNTEPSLYAIIDSITTDILNNQNTNRSSKIDLGTAILFSNAAN